MKPTREYQAYNNAKQRCYNPEHEKYASYGGRGIFMCQEWLVDYWKFLEDMGPCPPHFQLERKDNNGPYAPWNCKWATRVEQANNRRLRTTASGIGGISWRQSRGWFEVTFKSSYLGTRKDFFEACCLRKSKEARS